VLLCKKAAPLHFIQATPRLVLSAIIGNFANKGARFSRIVSHPSQKVMLNLSQWENTTLHESDCSLRLFSNSWDWYKTPAKNLNKFFRGGHGLFGLILAAPLLSKLNFSNCIIVHALMQTVQMFKVIRSASYTAIAFRHWYCNQTRTSMWLGITCCNHLSK